MTKRLSGRDLGLLLLSLLAGVLAIILWPVFLIAPALWTYAMFRTKPYSLAVLAAAVLAAAYYVYESWLAACCMAALAALPALALYVLSKRRLNKVYTAAIMAALATAALYGLVCLPGVLSGEGAFAAVQAMFQEAFAYSREAIAATPGFPESLYQSWSQYLDMFEESVPALIVPTLCGAACAMALANTLFFRLFVRKCDYGLAPLRPFCEWVIPASMTTGLMLFLVASIAVSCAGWEYAAGLSGTINVIVGFPLIVQGLATLDALIKRAKGNVALLRTLVYIGIGLLFSLLQQALVLLGCFDQIFHLRERIKTGQFGAFRGGK